MPHSLFIFTLGDAFNAAVMVGYVETGSLLDLWGVTSSTCGLSTGVRVGRVALEVNGRSVCVCDREREGGGVFAN